MPDPVDSLVLRRPSSVTYSTRRTEVLRELKENGDLDSYVYGVQYQALCVTLPLPRKQTGTHRFRRSARVFSSTVLSPANAYLNSASRLIHAYRRSLLHPRFEWPHN